MTETRVPRKPKPIHRNILDLIGALILASLAVMLVVLLGMQYWYAERIYPGVTVEGVSVGGLTRAAAIMQLENTLQEQPLPPLAVSYQDQFWPIAVGETAATVDTFDAVHQAYMIGRRGSLWERFLTQVDTIRGGADISAEVQTGQEPTALRAQSNRL